MKIDDALVHHVAGLAKLKIAEKDVATFKDHMQKTLGHVEELSSVKAQDVRPLTNPLTQFEEFYASSRLRREDQVTPSLGARELLQNAPDSKAGQFRVEAYWEDQ